MMSKVEPSLCDRSRSSPCRPPGGSRHELWPHLLNPDRLSDHIDRLYRAAWALCGSQHEAEDLVQETFLNVLKRPRLLRDGNEIGYLLRALRNTHANSYRAGARRPPTRQLFDGDARANLREQYRRARNHAGNRKRAGPVQRCGNRGGPPRPVLSRGRPLPSNPRSDGHNTPIPRTTARRPRTDQRDNSAS